MKQLPYDPVIVAAFRTPIGKYAGVLSGIRPDDLFADLMKNVVATMKLNVDDINEVIVGCANQAGEDNRNIARMSTLLAGLPNHVPAITVNRLCASGLDALIDGARRIITGEAQLVVAGGVESMSRAPYVMAKPQTGFKLGAPTIFDSSLGWRFYNDNMKERTPPEHNGVTAERLATYYKISRLQQDEYALLSHQRAIASMNDGFFAREIIPVTTRDRNPQTIKIDEGPRADTSLAKLGELKPAFLDGGSVTAGNSSSLNDGAALVVITSYDYAHAHSLPIRARIRGFAHAGVDPCVMGIGPVPAIKKVLASTSLTLADFHAIEINEAFSAQVLAVARELNIDEHRLNCRGGAIALGHPLGCSGARIVTTLINHLQTTKQHLGLASLCVGVGQGVAIALEIV